MATLRDIRRRIVGVKSTQKITKAMKMVAAAKMRRAQEAIVQARPYARKMAEMLRHMSDKVNATAYPLLQVRPVVTVAIVVVTADRGMCGAFNANIIRTAANRIEELYRQQQTGGNLRLYCVGKKGADFFTKRAYPVSSKYIGIFNGLNFGTARSIVAELTGAYLRGEIDRVEVIYNEFKNAAQQRIVVEQFLPLVQDQPAGNTSPAHGQVDYIYEPSSAEIISALVPKHLNFQIWRVLLESNAAEQGARMTAMENASTNARDLIRTLQLSYNKARQASITKELLEIVSGAEALKQAG
jgi:F-type H+-transporting ATPase subunit gamma